MARGSDVQGGTAQASTESPKKLDAAPNGRFRQGRRSGAAALYCSAGHQSGDCGRLRWDAAAARVAWSSICVGPICFSGRCSSAGLPRAMKSTLAMIVPVASKTAGAAPFRRADERTINEAI
jgi:hypothetical protein